MTGQIENIALGSVWQEVDPRCTRLVCVHAVSAGDTHQALGAAPIQRGRVTLIAVNPESLEPKPGSRYTFAKAERFNGKRGGYALRVQP